MKRRVLSTVVWVVLAVAVGFVWSEWSDPTPTGAPVVEPPVAPSSMQSPPPVASSAAVGIRGRVFRAGKPVEGARVVARTDGHVAEVSSGAAGAFSFDSLPVGQYLFSAASANESSRVMGPLPVALGTAADELLLELLPAGAVSGRVYDAIRRIPVAGALVRSSGGSARSDQAGRFLLSSLPAGPTWLEAEAEGYLPRVEWLSLDAAREHGGLEISLRPVAQISGRVVRAGVPVAYATVWAEAEGMGSSGAQYGPVRTDVQGRYALQAEGGVLQMAAAAEGGAG